MFKTNKFLRLVSYFALALCLLYLLLLTLFRPSHNRNWELGHEALPQITYSQNNVSIENYRDFDWTTKSNAEINYLTKNFNLDEMTGVDVFISHFSDFEGLAHIFLSFRFRNNENVVISLETRRETDEEFSPLLGVLRQFEIIYVVGSEEDIVGVRTGHRNERVYLYPTKATPDQARELFSLMAEKINSIHKKPQIYNTLTHNCTNELTRPVETMSDVNFPLTWKTVLPGYFDEVLYELGLIAGKGQFSEIKDEHLIKNSQVDVSNPTYSQDLRQNITKP